MKRIERLLQIIDRLLLRKYWPKKAEPWKKFCLKASRFFLWIGLVALIALGISALILTLTGQMTAIITFAFLLFTAVSFLEALFLRLIVRAINFKNPENTRIKALMIAIYIIKSAGLLFHLIVGIMGFASFYTSLVAAKASFLTTLSTVFSATQVFNVAGVTLSIAGLNLALLSIIAIVLVVCLLILGTTAFIKEIRYKKSANSTLNKDTTPLLPSYQSSPHFSRTKDTTPNDKVNQNNTPQTSIKTTGSTDNNEEETSGETFEEEETPGLK